LDDAPVTGIPWKQCFRNDGLDPEFSSMPRYYFDLREPATFTPDEEGEEFVDLDAATLRAIESLGELIRHFPPQNGDEVTIEIRREHEALIVRVSAILRVVRTS
jgi:hypothetical protein